MTDRRIQPPSERLEAAIRELVGALREEVRAEVRAVTAGPPRLLSIKEAADACGLSRASFYQLLGTGAVRSVHVGRRRLVPERALREFIDGGGNP